MDIKKIYKVIVSLLLVVAMTSCLPQKETKEENIAQSKEVSEKMEIENNQLERFDATFFDFFNTVTQVIIYAKSETEFNNYKEIIYNKMKYYHELFDIYNEYKGVTNVYTLNEKAAKAPVKVEPELFQFLQFCKEMYDSTNGQVNIAFGSVLKVWHKYREEGLDHPDQAKLPSQEELETASQHTDINNLVLDEKEQTVYFADDKLQLDVGAIAKGYSVQKIIDQAKKDGLKSGLISAGGNVSTIGMKPEQKRWQVGIQNPDKSKEETILRALELTNQSLVTSGDYERFYEVNGQIYHHIIDPITLFPAKYFHQVSILTEDSGFADALSTAVFLMPYEEGKKLIESLDNVEAVWVFPDYHIEVTSGMAGKFID